MYTTLQRTRKSSRKTKNAPGWFGGDESALATKMQHSGMDKREGDIGKKEFPMVWRLAATASSQAGGGNFLGASLQGQKLKTSQRPATRPRAKKVGFLSDNCLLSVFNTFLTTGYLEARCVGEARTSRR